MDKGEAITATPLPVGTRPILFVTSNPRKAREYRDQCRLYGIDVETIPRLENSSELESTIKARLYDPSQPPPQRCKPKFVLDEESDLYNARTDIKSTRDVDMEPVYNLSTLTAYSLDDEGQLVKKHYSSKIQGYLDLARRKPEADVFDWDDVFINSATGLSYHEQISAFGEKASARTQTIGDFIQRHLHYDTRRELKFAPKPSAETIDFNNSVAEEVAANPLLQQNTHLGDWGLDHLLGHMLNDGVHTRAPSNRREKTYWAPGLNAGLPNVAKKDAIRELRYRFHDMMHYAIAPATDLVVGRDFSPELKNVQHVTRMMSEAITIVMADMLFIDTMERSGISYDYASLPIYQLYKALEVPGDTNEAKMTHLLRASVEYALTGNDALFRAMLKPGQEARLEAYEETYGRYFVGDHRWTDANFNNLSQQKETLSRWRNLIGDDLIDKAHLTTLETFADRLKKRGADLSSYHDIVDKAFDEVVNANLLQRLREEPASLSTEARTSNAFRRYMIGQLAFYVKYGALDGMQARGEAMAETLRTTEQFSVDDIARIRKQFSQDVFRVQGAQLISHDDRHVYSQVYPLFQPFYLSGYQNEERDIAGAVNRLFDIKNKEHAMTPEVTTEPANQPQPKHGTLLLGPPGVGKSTQSKALLDETTGIMRLSTGELVRAVGEKIKRGEALNPTEARAAETLENHYRGELMDDDAVYALMVSHLAPGGAGHEDYKASHTVLLDGVVKAERNIAPFHRALDTLNATMPDMPLALEKVIHIDAPDEVLTQRSAQRAAEAIRKGEAPRQDDQPESYARRLGSYRDTTQGVLDHYEAQGMLTVLDANAPQNRVTQRLKGAMPVEAGHAESISHTTKLGRA